MPVLKIDFVEFHGHLLDIMDTIYFTIVTTILPVHCGCNLQ